MTPSKIVAPVGSEVVVLAGICGSDGYFIKNQPLEWRLSNDSAGEIIEVGGMQHRAFNRLVPPTSRKVDGQFAYGRTGMKRMTLSRGTPTCDDDIDLREGQSYISVSSASPGVSYVTGVAPKAEGWDRRRAQTTIHWVDATWSIPVPVSATAGTVTPLTTVVSRTDGNGVVGWPVRYTVVGGAPAEFAPAGSTTAEATTDANGQATVQIRQPINQFEPGTTQVRVDVIRPALFGQPEMVVESGLTTVTWSAPALTIRAIGPRTAEADTPFTYRLEITNPGDQAARNVIVRTKDLSSDINYLSATPKPTAYGNLYQWEIGDVAPNAAPQVIEVQLDSQRLGTAGLCFEVLSETDQLQTEACAETEIVEPCFELTIDSPGTARIGDRVTFLIKIRNRCNQPLENVGLSIAYDPGLSHNGPNPLSRRLDGSGMMNVGESLTFPFEAVAQATGQQAIVVDVTADGVRPERTQSLINVTENSTSIPTTPPIRDQQESLRIDARQIPTPASFNANISTLEVRLTNQGTTPIDDVTLNSRVTSALTPAAIPNEVGPVGSTRLSNDGQLFTPIQRINPGQTVTMQFGFEGQQNDPNASVQLSATSIGGDQAVETVRLPATTGGASNPPNTSTPNGDPVFGIPGDDQPLVPPAGLGQGQPGGGQFNPAPGAQNQVVVRIQPLNTELRSGQKTKVAFLVENRTDRPLSNVEIDFIKPNTLIFGDNERFTNNFGYTLAPGMRLPRIPNFPPGERLEGELELAAGTITGPATLEIQLRSDQTQGVLTDQTTINIR